MPERLVVIGGDAAGMSGASQARRRRGGEELEIVAFERGNFTSYSACGIPYFIGGEVEDLDRLIVRKPERFRSEQSIDVRINHEVTAIELAARTVEARDLGAGRTYVEGFDQLLVATGAIPRAPRLEGVDAAGIFGVQVLDHAVAIKRFVEEEQPRRAVIVGAGYIGVEMAEAFVNLGLDVAVIEQTPQPMTTLDPDMGACVGDAMRSMGIDLHSETSITGFEVIDGRVRAVATSDGEVAADIVVLGLGVAPNVELARASGIPIGASGAIEVDRRMAVPGLDGVWAAGDCAEKFHLVSRRSVAFPLGTHANKEGRVAGINLAGGYATFPGVVGTAVSKLCGLEVARTGLKEPEAAAAGFDFLTVIVDSKTRAGYYPGASDIKTKLVVESRSGRLLGGQIVGQEGAAKRIDVIATALWNEMTVDRMLNLDLSYAPPFAPVWDPVLIAARKAWERVEESLV